MRSSHVPETYGRPNSAERVDTLADVHISIVNHARTDLLRECLLSLPAACGDLRWRVSVVDNVPDDRSTAMLREEFPTVHVLPNTLPDGFGVNQNQVLGAAVEKRSARYLLVLNNDTCLSPGSVATLVAWADGRPALGAVGPRTWNTDGSPQPSSFRFPALWGAVRSAFQASVPSLGCVERETGEIWLGGACLLLRAEALRDVGGFDPRFFLFFEDIDLCRRMWDAGWGVGVCPEASIVHHNHGTVSQREIKFAMQCQMRRSAHLYMEKYHGRSMARAITTLVRTSLVARAIWRRVRIQRTRRVDDQASAKALWALARYNPAKPLPHERMGR